MTTPTLQLLEDTENMLYNLKKIFETNLKELQQEKEKNAILNKKIAQQEHEHHHYLY